MMQLAPVLPIGETPANEVIACDVRATEACRLLRRVLYRVLRCLLRHLLRR